MTKILMWEKEDDKYFYMASMGAFLVVGLLCFVVWIPWTMLENEMDLVTEIEHAEGPIAREVVFLRWVAPGCVGVSNLVFAAYAFLRFSMNGAYSARDFKRNHMVLFSGTSDRLDHYRLAVLRANVASAGENQDELLRNTQDRAQRYLVRHITDMRRLSKIVKIVLVTLLGLIFAIHIAIQLVPHASHAGGKAILAFLVGYLLVFVIFIFVSFSRVTHKMMLEVEDLPALKSLKGYCENDWVRAGGLCALVPLLPIVLLLSFANQGVRRMRGLVKNEDHGPLTRRVQMAIDCMAEWDRLHVLACMYIVSLCIIVSITAPIFLNVFLSWMSAEMHALAYWQVCVATVLVGIFLFLLPPVPGAAVYPFMGVVLADPRKGPPGGFWGGIAISIVLSILTKFVASAICQKVIGELLGSDVAIRQSCGVHKPGIRAVESLMQKPGLSWGKCMVFSGCPDWPTSVLAGILKLPLLQCLLGALPVIPVIIPMTLTGAFYLRREESEAWNRSVNMMLFLTTALTAILFAGIGSALQGEFDKYGDKLSKLRPQDIELEWLDVRQARVAELSRARWEDAPLAVRELLAAGACTVGLMTHLFVWSSNLCFGSFSLTDDIATLRWFGDADGLLRPLGIVGLLLYAVAWVGYALYKVWYSYWSRQLVKEATAEVDAQEEQWKSAALTECIEDNR